MRLHGILSVKEALLFFRAASIPMVANAKALSPATMRPRVYHSSPTIVEDQTTWNFTSTFPHAFMEWCLGTGENLPSTQAPGQKLKPPADYQGFYLIDY
jgi:hypothetical protein